VKLTRLLKALQSPGHGVNVSATAHNSKGPNYPTRATPARVGHPQAYLGCQPFLLIFLNLGAGDPHLTSDPVPHICCS